MTKLIPALTQIGNSKLKEAGMLMFNMPAGKAFCNRNCPGCYAVKEQVRFPKTFEARLRRYEAALEDDFADRIILELKYMYTKPKYYRVHSSGEFISQRYVDDWVKIAKTFPDIIFYAYTKRIKDFDFSILKILPNFILIDSLQHGRINYGKLKDAPKGAFICPAQPKTGVVCGVTCNYCMRKEAQDSAPYFKKH